MSHPFLSPGRIAIAVLALSMFGAPACRCTGGVTGNVNDAGFTVGTPPSATPASRECGGEPCCGDPPEPCSRWLAKQKDAGTATPVPVPSG